MFIDRTRKAAPVLYQYQRHNKHNSDSTTTKDWILFNKDCFVIFSVLQINQYFARYCRYCYITQYIQIFYMIGFYIMPSISRFACFCVCCSVDFVLIFKPISQLENRAQAPQIKQIRAFLQITVYFLKKFFGRPWSPLYRPKRKAGNRKTRL